VDVFGSVIRKRFAKYLVFKGSVAVDGISLTIANLTDEYFEIAVIPEDAGTDELFAFEAA
jgi:riboflavin synthase